MEKSNQNYCELRGNVLTKPEVTYSILGENFYSFKLETKRLNNEVTDEIVINISDRLFPRVSELEIGEEIHLSGRFSSRNESTEDGKRHLRLFVFVKEVITDSDEDGGKVKVGGKTYYKGDNIDYVEFQGYICNHPTFRKTPLGREITDVMIAINRNYGKSDYIPLITWGRNAQFASTLGIGDEIRVRGRIQSREYRKNIGNNEYETRVAYEVSTYAIELVSKFNGGDDYVEDSSEGYQRAN